jgi:hypothetical protein
MSERRRVWGLYDYENKLWIQTNDSPPRRRRFFSGIEAYNAAEHHGANIQPRPFYIKLAGSLPDDVKALIAAARVHAVGLVGQTGGEASRTYMLIGGDGSKIRSALPGALGGHSRLRIFGRLDCPSALRHLALGHYQKYRVFFADAASALAAGYRPCARCLPSAYAAWKAASNQKADHIAATVRALDGKY